MGDGRLDTTLASIDLFSNTPFALALTSNNPLASFQVTVAAVSSVPEPATLALFGAAVAGLGLARRRKKTVGAANKSGVIPARTIARAGTGAPLE